MIDAENGHQPPSSWQLLLDAEFDIGGEDQLESLHSRYSEQPEESEPTKQLTQNWLDFIAKVQIQTGTLLKTDSVSFLLGAGASKECGGVLIGKVPLDVERALLEDGISGTTNQRVRKWVLPFYQAATRAKGNAESIPLNRQEILVRRAAINAAVPPAELPVNLESLLSQLWRWRAALPEPGGRMQMDGTPSIDLRSEDLDECLRRATQALAVQCRLPRQGVGASAFDRYKHLLRKVLTRPLNLKRVNLFTLNYDTLVEQAADAEGVVLVDGFVGTVRRVFRPESYDHDLYFPAETTEGRVHRFDRVAHLYKLHGSITWRAGQPDWNNPYGVAAGPDEPNEQTALIYPTPAKIGETLGMPYAELFRRFAGAVVRPQSTLFVLGYGFGDDHVNAIIRQALTVPSFTLVIVDPNPISDFVGTLNSASDRRVWIFSGRTFGTFGGFVERVLPDLRDEDVRRKIAATWRALRSERAEAVGAEENAND